MIFLRLKVKTGIFLLKMAKSVSYNSFRQSSNLEAFRELFSRSRNVFVLTGAGVSAESGVPTFRGAGGLWRKYRATDLATPEAFEGNPSLVWEFYHYRRELCVLKHPNKGHVALAEAEAKLEKEGKHMVVVTQNVDELHKRAGTKNLIEMHGSLYTTRCTKCGDVRENYDSPICAALAGRGAPDADADSLRIATSLLPHCSKENCVGLLRPHIVWFGESLDPKVLDKIDEELARCDLFVVVGTSSTVYPAAGYANLIASRGVPIAEFNVETTPMTHQSNFYFEGPSGEMLTKALAPK